MEAFRAALHAEARGRTSTTPTACAGELEPHVGSRSHARATLVLPPPAALDPVGSAARTRSRLTASFVGRHPSAPFAPQAAVNRLQVARVPPASEQGGILHALAHAGAQRRETLRVVR